MDTAVVECKSVVSFLCIATRRSPKRETSLTHAANVRNEYTRSRGKARQKPENGTYDVRAYKTVTVDASWAVVPRPWHIDPYDVHVKQPILFGSSRNDTILVELFTKGAVPKSQGRIPQTLYRSGLVADAKSADKGYVILDRRHPTYPAVETVLRAMTGSESVCVPVYCKPTSAHLIDARHPLGHANSRAFAFLRYLISANGMDVEELRYQLVDVSPKALRVLLADMEAACLIERVGPKVTISPTVPESYRALVTELGEILAKRDKRIAHDAVPAAHRVTGFSVGKDGAPPLFGTTARLRNLMAIAKHGPMYLQDLRAATGTSKAKIEDEGDAPFGRGNVVQTWPTEHGYGVDFHPTYPLRLPLRKLLLKMEQSYPLPAHRSVAKPPAPQSVGSWRGDKLALFGGAIATNILLSIGALGWTFEALCVSLCTGYDRVVVKKSLRRLEECGILRGDRERKPGFNVRVIRIAETFCARNELQEVLDIACTVWPSFAKRVHFALNQLPSVTKVQLLRRSLLGTAVQEVQPPSWRRLSIQQRRRECVRRYCELTTIMARDLSSYEIGKLDCTLYRHIRSSWDSFAAFRRAVGLAPITKSTRTVRSDELRDWCVNRYLRWSELWGRNPSSDQLIKKDPQLVRCIYVQWGGFPQFYSDLGFSPLGKRRSARSTTDEKKADCRREYRELSERLGRPALPKDMHQHTVGLYKRIRNLWGGLPAFRKDLWHTEHPIDLRRRRGGLVQ